MNVDGMPASYSEAKRTGASHYFTGSACKRGHIERRNATDGSCAGCARLKSNEWAKKNRPKMNARKAKWYAAKPDEYKRRHNDQCRKRVLEDKGSLTSRLRKYRDHNREKLRAYFRKWVKENPDKAREANRISWNRRRLRKLGVEGRHTAADIRDIKKMQRSRCGYCREVLGERFHVDHIVAISRGGSDSRSNIQLLCRDCNQSKWAHDPIEFARSLGRLI